MQFDWKCFFEILNAVWGTSQKQIAMYLEVNESTITRLKNNQIGKTQLTASRIYGCLFDLEKAKSMASSFAPHSQREIINIWIEELTKRNLKQVIANSELDDYKEFFNGLLTLLTEKPSSTSVNQQDALCNNVPTQIQHRNIDKNPQKNPDELYHSFEEYGINAFIVYAPTDCPQYLIEDATRFIGHVNPNLRHWNRDQKNDAYERSPLYPQIINFTEHLAEYLNFLKEHCKDLINFPYSFELKHDIDENFLQEADIHLEKLRNLYSDIKSAIELERDRYSKELRALSKQSLMPID